MCGTAALLFQLVGWLFSTSEETVRRAPCAVKFWEKLGQDPTSLLLKDPNVF